MPNDVKLQEGHPVDENLRPIKVGGKSTAIETAQHGNGARINGDLLVTGAVPSDDTKLPISGGTMTGDITTDSNIVSTDLTIDDSGDIALDAAGGDVTILQADLTIPVDKKVIFGNTGEYIVGDDTDLDIVSSNDATINAGGTIILDSADGTFEMHGAGSTAKFADMYAGMILGYTALGVDSADDSYTTTTSWAVVDSTTKVSFVAPPSGNVEISISVYVDTDIARWLEFGLSDNASYSPIDFPNSNDVTNEHTAYKGDETDEEMVSHQWVVTGLTSGTSYEWWFAVRSSPNAGAYTLKWGGNVTSEYSPFIMKATALPSTIYTG